MTCYSIGQKPNAGFLAHCAGHAAPRVPGQVGHLKPSSGSHSPQYYRYSFQSEASIWNATLWTSAKWQSMRLQPPTARFEASVRGEELFT
jgi:hypothetical protein